MRLPVDRERHALGLVGERPRRQHHPRLLLRRRVGLRRVGLGHQLDHARHVGLGDAGLRRQRDEGRPIAHGGAVVAPRVAVVLAGHALEGGLQGALGTGPVAHHGERGAELGLRQRRAEVVELGVDVVAQLADRRPAVARQHVERIGPGLAAPLEVLRVADVVRQAVERLVERLLAHRVVGLLGARQEVGDVAGQPHVAVGRPPDAEGARGVLHLQHARDGAVDALAHLACRWRGRCAWPRR